MVRVCHTHYQSKLALVCFTTIEEAIQAKTGLDKNPFIAGILVSAQFASEANIKELCQQFQVSLDAEQRERENKGWPGHSTSSGGPAAPSNGKQHPQNAPLSLANLNSSAIATTPQWEGHTPGGFGHYARQNSEVSTPGSSMWSDGGFLSGVSSPWFSSGPVSSTSMGSSTSGPCSMTSPQESANTTITTGQSLLPGGLL